MVLFIYFSLSSFFFVFVGLLFLQRFCAQKLLRAIISEPAVAINSSELISFAFIFVRFRSYTFVITISTSKRLVVIVIAFKTIALNWQWKNKQKIEERKKRNKIQRTICRFSLIRFVFGFVAVVPLCFPSFLSLSHSAYSILGFVPLCNVSHTHTRTHLDTHETFFSRRHRRRNSHQVSEL